MNCQLATVKMTSTCTIKLCITVNNVYRICVVMSFFFVIPAGFKNIRFVTGVLLLNKTICNSECDMDFHIIIRIPEVLHIRGKVLYYPWYKCGIPYLTQRLVGNGACTCKWALDRRQRTTTEYTQLNYK